VVNATPRPLYPPEKPGTHCTGGWLGPTAGPDGAVNTAPMGIRSSDHPTRSESLHRLSYRGLNLIFILYKIHLFIWDLKLLIEAKSMYFSFFIFAPCFLKSM